MKRYLVIGLGIIGVLMGGVRSPSHAQFLPGTDGGIVPPHVRDKIRSLKQLERNALREIRNSDWQQAQSSLAAVDDARINLGQKNLTTFAQALAREALDHSKRRGGEEVWEILDWAERVAPVLPDVDFARARLSILGGGLQPGRAIVSLLSGMKKSNGGISNTVLLLLNVLSRILVSLIMALALFGAVLALRKLKCLNHDFSHLFPFGTSGAVTWALTVLVFLLPVVFRVPLFLTLGFWIGLGIMYARPLERGIALAGMVILAAVPFSLGPMSSFLIHTQGGGTQEIISVQEREWGVPEIERLARWVRDNPNDREAAFVMGSLWKKVGEYPRALVLLRQAEEVKELKAAVLNNRGNIYYGMGKKDEVIPQYQQAIKLNPQLASAHFNVSQVLFSDARLTEGQQERARAKELDPNLVNWFARVGNPNIVNRFLADEEIPGDILKNRFFTSVGRENLIENWFRSRFFWGLPPAKVLILFLVIAVLAIIITIILSRLGRSLVCPRCGKIACRRCHRFAQAEGLCSQCYFIYVRKGGIDPQERVIKEFEIQRHNQRRRWLSILVSLPLIGTGHFLHGRPALGLILSFFYWFFLSKILFPHGVFPGTYSLSFGVDWIGIAGAVLGMLILYLVGMLSVISLEEE